MDTKKVGILCYYKFPEGMAPTNRIRAYCKGLSHAGAKPEVILFRPCLLGDGCPVSGDIDGFHYSYSHQRDPGRNTFYKLFVDRPKALINSVRMIYRSHRRERFDYIFFSFDSLRFLFFFSLALKPLGVRLLFIGDEFPYPIRIKLKDKIPFWRILLYKTVFSMIGFRVLMTRELMNFFNREISQKPTHILPSITDVERFRESAGIKCRKNYLCYMGNMELSKDNVDNIIRAFSLFSRQIHEYELHLFGIPKDSDRMILENLIDELNLKDKVFLKGRVDFHVVPEILSEAKVLLSSQPKTRRAQGGFPTKLGEYFMSGTPTLMSSVGEIPLFVKDGVNGYLVEPCDPEAYSEKLRFIIDHYEEALEVGARGRQFILDNFSAEKVGGDLKKFLDEHLND